MSVEVKLNSKSTVVAAYSDGEQLYESSYTQS